MPLPVTVAKLLLATPSIANVLAPLGTEIVYSKFLELKTDDNVPLVKLTLLKSAFLLVGFLIFIII